MPLVLIYQVSNYNIEHETLLIILLQAPNPGEK